MNREIFAMRAAECGTVALFILIALVIGALQRSGPELARVRRRIARPPATFLGGVILHTNRRKQ
jgi:hypothetical protein